MNLYYLYEAVNDTLNLMRVKYGKKEYIVPTWHVLFSSHMILVIIATGFTVGKMITGKEVINDIGASFFMLYYTIYSVYCLYKIKTNRMRKISYFVAKQRYLSPEMGTLGNTEMSNPSYVKISYVLLFIGYGIIIFPCNNFSIALGTCISLITYQLMCKYINLQAADIVIYSLVTVNEIYKSGWRFQIDNPYDAIPPFGDNVSDLKEMLNKYVKDISIRNISIANIDTVDVSYEVSGNIKVES